jgi:thiol-disulfide isomerase/thioredoxin
MKCLYQIRYKILNNFNMLINSKKALLVVFYDEWCGSCKTMVSILKELKTQLSVNQLS